MSKQVQTSQQKWSSKHQPIKSHKTKSTPSQTKSGKVHPLKEREELVHLLESDEKTPVISFTLDECRLIIRNARDECIFGRQDGVHQLLNRPTCQRIANSELMRSMTQVENDLRTYFLPGGVHTTSARAQNIKRVKVKQATNATQTVTNELMDKETCVQFFDVAGSKEQNCATDNTGRQEKATLTCKTETTETGTVPDTVATKDIATSTVTTTAQTVNTDTSNLILYANKTTTTDKPCRLTGNPALDTRMQLTGNDLQTISIMVLQPYTTEYQRLKRRFLDSIGITVKVVQICTLINPYIFARYALKKDLMEAQDRSQQLERTLWHGSNADAIKSINYKGLLLNFLGTNATAYGKGLYFARDASYSHNYATPSAKSKPLFGPKDRYMYLARVLTGDYVKGQGDFKIAPYKDEQTETRYDSVVQNVVDPSIFVVFDQEQAYPEYLIKYQA